MKAILSLFLVLLVVAWSVEGSKFKELYGDKIEKPAKTAQSKFKSIYGDLLEHKESASSVDSETPTNKYQHHEEQIHHSPPPSFEEPLPSRFGWKEITFVMAIAAVSVLLQVKQYSVKKDHVTERRIEESDSLSESDEILEESKVTEEKGKEREQVEKKDESSNFSEKDINEGNATSSNNENEKEDEETRDKEKDQEKEEEEEEKEKDQEKEEKEKEKEKEKEEEEWIVVGKPSDSPVVSRVNEGNLVKGSESESDNEKQLVLARENDENKETQLVLRKTKGNSDMAEVTAMMEALNIKFDPNCSTQEKLEMIKVVQTQMKLRLKKESSENALEIKRQNHELRKQKEKRRKEKEIERQAYIVEEQKKQKLLDDNYHKMIILHLAAGIILTIWLQVMNFSLFQLPFLSSSLSSSSSSTSYLSAFFSVPSSLSIIYNLASWSNAIKFVYILILFIIFIVLCIFVPKLAPYFLLVISFMHSYLSLFRAAAYFVLGQWSFVSLSFSLFGKLLPEHKTVKLLILYTTNIAIAAILGNVIARGDPLNPYPQEFFSDSFVSYVFSFLY